MKIKQKWKFLSEVYCVLCDLFMNMHYIHTHTQHLHTHTHILVTMDRLS